MEEDAFGKANYRVLTYDWQLALLGKKNYVDAWVDSPYNELHLLNLGPNLVILQSLGFALGDDGKQALSTVYELLEPGSPSVVMNTKLYEMWVRSLDIQATNAFQSFLDYGEEKDEILLTLIVKAVSGHEHRLAWPFRLETHAKWGKVFYGAPVPRG